jgi:1,4-alpha-glucan branching enzyme
MGDEFAQEREWNHEASLDWHLLADPMHRGVQRWVRDLNTLYRGEPVLYEQDAEPRGLDWVDCSDTGQSVVSLMRTGFDPDRVVIFVFNFTPVPRASYRIGVPWGGRWTEILNSDASLYGGSGQGNLGGAGTTPVASHGHAQSIVVTVPPLAIVVFKGGR